MTHLPWSAFQMIFFDCDSTLSTIEGIDELAKSRGLFEEVQRLTNAAMDGEVHLESVYDRRLQLLRPTRGEIRRVERLYRETVVPDAKETLAALTYIGKEVFIISGGLYAAVRPFGEWLGVPADHIRAVEVVYDTFSGQWWDYQRDQWGQRPDVNYLKHRGGPLVQSTGKAAVVRDLIGTRPGRSLLVGDGMSDLAAQEALDCFVGFGGVITRTGVQVGASIFIHCLSLTPILPLTLSKTEQQRLRNSQFAPLLQTGINFIQQQAVTFKHATWREAVLQNSLN